MNEVYEPSVVAACLDRWQPAHPVVGIALLVCVFLNAGCGQVFSPQIVHRTCSGDRTVCEQKPSEGGARITRFWGSQEYGYWAVASDVSGLGGVVLRWDGHAWLPEQIPVRNIGLNGIWGTNENDIWVVGEQGTILHWDGFAWSDKQSSQPTQLDLNAIWGGSPSDIVAVGDENTILRWDGTGWRKFNINFPFSPNWFGVWGSADEGYWIVGDNGAVVYITLDGKWKKMDTKSDGKFLSIYGLTADLIFSVGINGQFIKINKASVMTNAVSIVPVSPVAPIPDFEAVWADSENNMWLVGNVGKCPAAYRWTGTSLERHAEQFEQFDNCAERANAKAYRAVWGINDHEVWVGGTDGTIQRRRVF